jgi:hypothetical protein
MLVDYPYSGNTWVGSGIKMHVKIKHSGLFCQSVRDKTKKCFLKHWFQDPFEFEVQVKVDDVTKQTVTLAWSGVPTPHQVSISENSFSSTQRPSKLERFSARKINLGAPLSICFRPYLQILDQAGEADLEPTL